MKSRSILCLMAGVIIISPIIACSTMGNIVPQEPTPTKIIFGVEHTPGSSPQNTTSSDYWTGTIQSTTNGDYGAAGACTGEMWKSSLDLVVRGDGTVSGSGVAHIVAGAKCSGPGVKNLKTDATMAIFNVAGAFDGEKFILTFNETSMDGSTPGLFNYALLLGGRLEFSVTGKGSAGGIITVSKPAEGGGGTATADHIVDLKCADC
jgi:hypothetical protein